MAIAQGKVAISSVGLAPVKVRLTQPQEICGQVVFTHANFDIRERFNGHTHRFRDSLLLDDCLK